MSTDLERLVVGEPFPGPVPHLEGAVMELWENGLNVMIQMPDLRREEKQAFKKSFKKYYYLETTTSPPFAVWIFDFPKPHGPIDMMFGAMRANPEWVESFLYTSEGVKNLVQFFLLDGPILAGIKAIGVSSEAMQLFHGTIKKQLGMEYTVADYDRTLAVAFMESTDELMQKAQVFRHKKR